ncbi:MAG: RsmE family RNA methyltransferase [Acidimicrobiales bacterium]
MTHLEWPRRVAALAQFHVADPAEPVLERTDDHHLRKVLRATPGEEVVVTDGRGSWAICVVDDQGLSRVGDVSRDDPVPATTLYLAALKGDHAQWAVAKATEVGVARVVPLLTSRSVVKFTGDVRDKTLARWRRVAREAAGQCRRTYDLRVEEPLRVADVPGDVAVAEIGGSGDWRGVTDVAVGPEGGWAKDEWASSRRRVGLGPTVLRAETAGVVAAALLAFQSGGWGLTLDGGRYE